jgi:diguanylate cyclase (GGDEF)-like protein
VQSVQLSEQIRRRLIALLSEERPDAERLLRGIQDIGQAEGIGVFSATLHLLAHLPLPEAEAERTFRGLLDHREQLVRSLGRDPGLCVVALDYLSNVNKLLAHPTIVEAEQLEKTERSAITDDLTRLYNRRHFVRALSLEVRRSRRYGLRMSLLMLDLDAFKLLNDRHGHLLGDLVLQRVGSILRRVVREADVPCRFGGEEFAVILPETDRLGAYAVAERIRRGVLRGFETRPVAGAWVETSLSGGIASFPDDGADPAALIARADHITRSDEAPSATPRGRAPARACPRFRRSGAARPGPSTSAATGR